MSDDELLQAYVNGRSQSAFAELVRRHGQAYSTAASPDGKSVAIGLAFNNITLMDATNCSAARRLRRHQSIILGLAFSPESKKLASVSADKTVRVWDVR